MYTWPSDIADDGKAFLGLLGSLWQGAYAGAFQVEVLTTARTQLEIQTHRNLLEFIASISRFTIPVFHTDNWYFLEVNQADLLEASLDRYGEPGNFYGDGRLYGVPTGKEGFVYPCPADLAFAPSIVNRLSDPSVVWTSGTDYELTGDGRIRFRHDPFTPGLFAIQEVVDQTGTVTRRTAGLWVFRGKFDLKNVFEQFGYAFGLQIASSSEAYKILVNAVYDAYAFGPTRSAIKRLVTACTGVPFAKVDGEVVQLIATDNNGLLIATDQNAYRFSINANPEVDVGDVLKAGMPLTDAALFFDFNQGIVDQRVSALFVNNQMLGAGYFQGLVFNNQTYPTQILQDAEGFTEIRFPVEGFPADIDKFWNDVQAKGKQFGHTLAQLLDTRTVKTGQPTPASLPSMINPLQLLVSGVFRNHATLLRIIVSAQGPGALGFGALGFIKELIPPESAMLILIVMKPVSESLNPLSTTPGDPAVTEAVKTYKGRLIEESLDSNTYVQEGVKLTRTSGKCV